MRKLQDIDPTPQQVVLNWVYLIDLFDLSVDEQRLRVAILVLDYSLRNLFLCNKKSVLTLLLFAQVANVRKEGQPKLCFR